VTPFPCPAAPLNRRLTVYPNGYIGMLVSGAQAGNGFLSMFLVPSADSQPPGWSQHAKYSLTVVNQTDEKCNLSKGTQSYTFFKAGQGCGFSLSPPSAPSAINDVMSTPGYIVNNTLNIKCDITNISSNALAAAAASGAQQLTQRETRIVDADTAAAAAIAAAYPGTFLPAAAAALAAANPGAVSGGSAPRVAVPAGLYPTGSGGLLYLPPGALAKYY